MGGGGVINIFSSILIKIKSNFKLLNKIKPNRSISSQIVILKVISYLFTSFMMDSVGERGQKEATASLVSDERSEQHEIIPSTKKGRRRRQNLTIKR